MITCPLSHLNDWNQNPRLTSDATHIEELKASIEASGILQNLIVAEDPQKKDHYIVIAGGSRLKALQELQKEGKIQEDYPVPVMVKTVDLNNPEALAISLSENIVRREMDTMDECVAMAHLSEKGKTPETIAEIFGYTPRTIKQKLALGKIIPEAQAYIREKKRDLDWARAMTLADPATQKKIVDDMTVNPNAWKDAIEIKRHLTSETIPADHAIFDPSLYTGTVIYDMFESNKFADREMFFTLQMEACEALKEKLLEEGYMKASISNVPIDLWKYKKSSNPSESECIIELSPNGKVTVHKDLVEEKQNIHQQTEDTETLPEETSHEETLQGDAVRYTPAMGEYSANRRSAVLQKTLIGKFRNCLEITVMGLIGHSQIPLRAHDYRFSSHAHDDLLMSEIKKDHAKIDAFFEEKGLPLTNRNDDMVYTFVKSLNDDELNHLFTQLVAKKVGQSSHKAPDYKNTSLMNRLGEDLGLTSEDIRNWWTPDEHFFSMMATNDLRRLAQNLLPKNRQIGLLTAKKNNLVAMLTDAFTDAKDNVGTLDPSSRDFLNSWAPGFMKLPAYDQTQINPEMPETEEDAFSALFGESENNAETEKENL